MLKIDITSDLFFYSSASIPNVFTWVGYKAHPFHMYHPSFSYDRIMFMMFTCSLWVHYQLLSYQSAPIRVHTWGGIEDITTYHSISSKHISQSWRMKRRYTCDVIPKHFHTFYSKNNKYHNKTHIRHKNKHAYIKHCVLHTRAYFSNIKH